MMMIVLLLLSSCVCLGLSESYVEEHYGDMYKWMTHKAVHSLEFSPKDSSKVTILWRRDKSPAIKDMDRWKMGLYLGMICCYFELTYLTQEDSGHYIMRDKDQKLLSTKTIEVVENTRSYKLSPGERLRFTFNLEPNSCNIYFFPESDLELKESNSEIVRQGKLLRNGLDEINCVGFQLLKPCGILIDKLQMSCSGHYEVRDQNGNKALVASLEMEPLPQDQDQDLDQEPSYFGIGAGIFLAMCFCSCVRSCCCGKSSSKEDNPETETAAGPAVNEYDHEPVGPRPDELSQPSRTHYPAPPSYTPTAPLVHSYTDDVPPSYSEVVTSAEQTDAPTVPVYSAPEPRFEFKGMNYTSHSDDVYTSDKLNFL